VKGVAGTWKDLTDNVNFMATNLTDQVRNIAAVTTAVAVGDLTKKITVEVRGEIAELKNTINTMVDQLSSFASEVTRVAREVGTEGRLGGQAEVKGVAGTWKDLTDNVNFMASNLTAQVRNIADVTTAVARGDLSKKIAVDVRGEILELKDTINTLVDQLRSFASEVTRVAREVGTEGKLGGQAVVEGVGGSWKDLTDNVNFMASNLTAQVRGIARVVTAVAAGDLKQKLALEAKGEIAELAGTINSMIDTLAIFADQVTNVAREVGFEGKLGGQAKVPGAAGIWRDLTDNVNQLAQNLTTQVRAIAEVATAVTKGDLTRSIAVGAQGEVAALKDNINQMIANLRETTQKNTETDWLKTNLAKFTRMLQGHRDVEPVARLILQELAPLVDAQHGVFYLWTPGDSGGALQLLSSWAYRARPDLPTRFLPGDGLVGQCFVEKRRFLLDEVPESYVRIGSALGEASPRSIVVLPVLFEGAVKAVIELASLYGFSEVHVAFLDQLTESIGIVLNTIGASMKTEELLVQSQSLAEELRSQQQELTETNRRLEQQAVTLQASEERLRQQQAALEERAQQLALASKYKSEFLANMSHELRTPLNSMLILAKLFADNADGNLTGKQVDYANTIHGAGADLLALINDILDLSKIESGAMAIEIDQMRFTEMKEFVERTFRQVAQSKALDFEVELAPGAGQWVVTDPRRLQQVLKNLLSNAFKFTEKGKVVLRVERAQSGWRLGHETLDRADSVVAFSVTDTGIGIPADKQRIIFEAFQQADGTTSRKFGGTGLGLSISREIARLLGGEIRVESAPGKGSTFTLYVPQSYSYDMMPAQPPPQRLAAVRVAAGAAGGGPGLATAGADEQAGPPSDRVPMAGPVIDDDRHVIEDDDQVLLIVEDDPTFASLLLDQARARGFKGIVSLTGGQVLALARQYQPDGVTLDVYLPDVDGWAVLDRLKHDPLTRHIPVHLITASDEGARRRALRRGAIAFVRKPITMEALGECFARLTDHAGRRMRQLLVIEDDEVQRKAILELIGNGDVKTTAVGSGREALECLTKSRFDCVVLDLGLPDIGGTELLGRIKDLPGYQDVPVIVYTGRDVGAPEDAELKRLSDVIILKSVRSMEHLFDETALFLHRNEASMPESKRKLLRQVHGSDPSFDGKTVLVVDDDLRNIFALTSVLERHKMRVLFAENGRQGIEALRRHPHVDAVLMDVMMPEMDGYETMREIRRMPELSGLPIIALTAKAMKGDREKCIEAGASDYITKPVDVEQLLSLLRVWME
jgi:CheY-like chemotaxis protein/signal transduction histidine kinase/HAMP domain-containing protein